MARRGNLSWETAGSWGSPSSQRDGHLGASSSGVRVARQRSAVAITHISVHPEELGHMNGLGTFLHGFPFIFLRGTGEVMRRFLCLQGTKPTLLTGSQ